MKNFIIGALVIFLIGAIGYIFYQQSDLQNTPVQESVVPETQNNFEEVGIDKKIIGGDKDDHGCLIGAGYSWCEEKQKCLKAWEEECVKSSNDGIAEAMVEKYKKDLSEVTIIISQEEGDFARGGVEFAPGGQGNAGMFLAVRINGEWEIVYEGNGVADCNKLKQKYNYPQKMLQGICD